MECYKCKTTENLGKISKYSYACKTCTAGIAKAYYDKVRELVFNHYGKACACCGEDNELFLTIDHINNDGHTESVTAKKRDSGRTMYARIIRMGYPITFQTLCMNCNFGKMRNKGICPHIVDKQLKENQ